MTMTGLPYQGHTWAEADKFIIEQCGDRPRQECTIGPRTVLRRVSQDHIAVQYAGEIIIRYTRRGPVWLWAPMMGKSEAVRSRFNTWAPCGIDLSWHVLFRLTFDEVGNPHRHFFLADESTCPVEFYSGINVGEVGSNDAGVSNRV